MESAMVEEDQIQVEGLGQKLLSEMLKTPAVKEAILVNIRDMKADNAAGLVKTLLWTDAGFFLSMIGVLPTLVNYCVEFVLELGRQFGSMPAPLLKDFVNQVTGGLELERMAELPEVYGPFLNRMIREDPQAVEALLKAAAITANSAVKVSGNSLEMITEHLEQGRARSDRKALDREALAGLINSALRLINHTLNEGSYQWGELLASVDREEAKQVGRRILGLIPATAKGLMKVLWGGIMRGMKKKLSRLPGPDQKR
jgi:hypothetical protein